MLKILLGIEEVDITNVPANTILAAVDLTPSMTVTVALSFTYESWTVKSKPATQCV